MRNKLLKGEANVISMNKAVFSEVGPYSNQQLLPHVYLLVEGHREKRSFYQFHQVSVPPQMASLVRFCDRIMSKLHVKCINHF